MPQPVKTISVEELKKMMDEKADFQLIDVRERSEKEFADIGGTLIPMGSMLGRVNEIEKDKPVIIYCRSGNRSGRVIAALQEKFGFTNLYNLAGGILAWSDRIDPSVRKY
jgi:rhodanese-related sulfurtransferase